MNKRLLNILGLSGYISESMEKILEKYVDKWHCTAFDALLETHMMTESELADFLAHYFKMDRIYNVSTINLDPEVLQVLPFKLASQSHCLPLRFLNKEKSALEIFLADPTQDHQIEMIKNETGCELTIAIGEKEDIVNSIRELYPIEMQIPTLHIT